MPWNGVIGIIFHCHVMGFSHCKIAVLTQHLVPPIRLEYFRLHTQHFESGLTKDERVCIYIKAKV